MPLTPAFTFVNPAGVPSSVIGTDTSTGSDVLIVSRRIYFEKTDGTYLVPSGTVTDYIPWVKS